MSSSWVSFVFHAFRIDRVRSTSSLAFVPAPRRHNLARCAPISARDSSAHRRHGEHRQGDFARTPERLRARVLGRCDVRRSDALPVRRSVGASPHPPQARAQHSLPSPRPWSKRRRVHVVPRQCHLRGELGVLEICCYGLAEQTDASSTVVLSSRCRERPRYLPRVRLAQLHREHEARY